MKSIKKLFPLIGLFSIVVIISGCAEKTPLDSRKVSFSYNKKTILPDKDEYFTIYHKIHFFVKDYENLTYIDINYVCKKENTGVLLTSAYSTRPRKELELYHPFRDFLTKHSTPLFCQFFIWFSYRNKETDKEPLFVEFLFDLKR